jgi:hypothetical protein
MGGKPVGIRGEWVCPAYGPDGAEFGAVCFFAAPGEQVCPDADTCAAALADRRRSLFGRISGLAAHGDEAGEVLAAEIARPDQLLGGQDDGSEAGR